jgi:predicted membrane protein
MSGKDRIRRRVGRIRHGGGATAGLILVGIGILLLLHNFGIFRMRDIFSFWPVFPIAWGLQAIVRGRSFFTYLIGGVAVALGTLKLLDNLDVVAIGNKFYAPIILITLGVAFLARNMGIGGEDGVISNSGAGGSDSEPINLPRIHPVAVFGGVKRRVEAQEFEGGEIEAVFGGVELDFRRSKMKGESASVEVNAVFGGVQMRVPENWAVEFRGVAVFGGFEDQTITPRPTEGGPVQKLIITGNAVFGGVSVEN